MTRSPGYRSAHSDSQYTASPILSALLMVCITVVFVAVLGSFSFGIFIGTAQTPQASFSTEVDVGADRIIISHRGGETLTAERTSIIVVNESDDETLRFSPTEQSISFEVGDSVAIQTSTGTLEGWELEPGQGTFSLDRGVTYTINIEDTRSGSAVYRTSVTTA